MSQKTNKQLTKKQLQVIEALAQGLDIRDMPTKCNIVPATFRKWITSEMFEQELRFRLETGRRQSELLLGQNAPAAAQKLITLMDEKDKPDVARKACLDILNLTSKSATPPKPETSSQEATKPLDEEVAAAMLNLLSNAK